MKGFVNMHLGTGVHKNSEKIITIIIWVEGSALKVHR
jgi:hypothetical protein